MELESDIMGEKANFRLLYTAATSEKHIPKKEVVEISLVRKV